MKIAFLPSVNGFGHTRRLLSLALPLAKMDIDCHFLLPCQLKSNSRIIEIIEQHRFSVEIICSDGIDEGPYVDFERHRKCFSKYNKFKLGAFDHIICDSLTWLHDLHSSTILFAQFTWTLFDKGTREFITQDLSYLKFKKIFGIKHFSQPDLTKLKNFQSIPILDYWNLSKYENYQSEPKIYLASNGVEDIDERVTKLHIDIEHKVINGIEMHLKSHPKPLGIICRPGLSTIMECLSAGILPILLEPTDAELRHNFLQTIEMNLGISINGLISKDKKDIIRYLFKFKEQIKTPEILSSAEFVKSILVRELA